MAGGILDQTIAQALVHLRLIVTPAVKTEMELKTLLPKGALIISSIPRIKITSDARRDRLWVVIVGFICFGFCLALIGFIWEIHLML
jgi:hypothetical protein